MDNIKNFQLSGTLSVCTDESGGIFIQFLPDYPECVKIEGRHFEGSVQLLSSGQLELVSDKSNNSKN